MFLCTGNVFRSLSAERLLKKHLEDKDRAFSITSRGTNGREDRDVVPTVKNKLKTYGVDVEDHVSRKITKSEALDQDLIISMSEDHKSFLNEDYGIRSPTFKEVIGEEGSILDWHEALDVDSHTSEKGKEYLENTIEYIQKHIDDMYESLVFRFYKFTDLLSGDNNENGAEFKILKETDHSVAFLAIDRLEDTFQILVIPKQKYKYLHSLPTQELHDLMDLVRDIGSTLNDSFGGYNVWQNNGWTGDQRIFHVHFHMMPRNNTLERLTNGDWYRTSIEEYNSLYSDVSSLF